MSRLRWVFAVLLGALLLPSFGYARDFGALVLPIHEGKWTSSLLYEHLKLSDDFDVRGEADFESQVVGSQFSFGITDQIAMGIKGGVLINPQQEAQGTQWEGRAGYLYGIDLFNEIFPATGYRPGIMISAGVTGFYVPLDRQINTDGTVDLIDQRLTGADYHAAMVLAMKLGRFSPYGGVRLFGRSVDWHDNQSAANGGPANIHGDANGNASIVAGLPIRLTQELQFHVEGIFVSETAVTAGFTLAAF